MSDRNDLAFWLPPLVDAGLPVPKTELVLTDIPLADLLDGKDPEGWDEFLGALHTAVCSIGVPCFLRTGHTSGKHEWEQTCYLADIDRDVLAWHVSALVEHSALAGFLGLPTGTWAVRELIPTTPICRCGAYGGMPVVREFRFFVRSTDDRHPASGGYEEHHQPYWPSLAVAEGVPDKEGWQEALAEASVLTTDEHRYLAGLALDALRAVGGGFWSVDFLQDASGTWWLTDMAQGDVSFRYEPEVP